MGNCLVTKLKGTVDNDALPKLGFLNFKVESGDDVGIGTLTVDEEITATVTGNCYFTNDNGSENLGKSISFPATPATKRIRIKGDGYCNISSKYKYSYLAMGNSRNSIDVAEIAHIGATEIAMSSSRTSTNGANCYGDVTDLVLKANSLKFSGCSNLYGKIDKTIENRGGDITTLYLYNTGVEFNFDLLEKMPNLTSFIGGDKVSGDFSKLGFTKVPDLYLSTPAANALTGSIENFVSNRIASGQTSGTFNLQWPNTFLKVTYKGTPLPNNDAITDKTGNCTFTWDSSGNITWGSK